MGQRQGRLLFGVFRCSFGRLGEKFLGFFGIAILQIHLAGDGVDFRIDHAFGNALVQRYQRFGRLAGAQVSHDQHAARQNQVRGGANRFGQQSFSLHQGIELKLNGPG